MFSKYRARLLEGEVTARFPGAVWARPKVVALVGRPRATAWLWPVIGPRTFRISRQEKGAAPVYTAWRKGRFMPRPPAFTMAFAACRRSSRVRQLNAMLLVADRERTLILTGNGDVLEPEHGVAAIGTGGDYALSAARALIESTDFGPREIAEKAMKIAADICVFTNDQITIEVV